MTAAGLDEHEPFGGRDRSTLRRFAEVRGVIGGNRMPHETVRLFAQDGVSLAATHLPGPRGAPGLVHLHGFGAHRRKPAYAGFTDVLAESFDVLSVDLRGHGQSGGRSSLGDREVLDVQAAIAWMRARGHPWVAVVGVSMGGTSAVHSLTLEDGPDAVVAISAPAYLHAEPRTAPMARLHLLWTSPRHRFGLRAVTGVRVVPVAQWESPPHPADVVARSTTPVLLVHGQDDPYFGVEEWEPIALQYGIPLWAEPVGFGHAEDGLTPAFARRVAGAVHSVWRTGQFPERDEHPR